MQLGSTQAKAAKLPTQGSDPTGTVTISGWGYLKEGGGSLPTNLQTLDVPVVPREKCNTQYNGDITANMFCAGVDAGGKDACQVRNIIEIRTQIYINILNSFLG